MKNAIERLKANKSTIIRRTLIVAGTATAIILVGYAYKRNLDGVDALEDVAEAIETSA